MEKHRAIQSVHMCVAYQAIGIGPGSRFCVVRCERLIFIQQLVVNDGQIDNFEI